MRPRKVNILGKEYKVEYCDTIAEVDESESSLCEGVALLRQHRIRVHDGGTQDGQVWHTLIHEIIEVITSDLSISSLSENHDDLDRVACALADVLIRNRWLKP